MLYTGECLSRKEIAERYRVSTATLNRWLSEKEAELQLQQRRILRPCEIDRVIAWWGDFRGVKEKQW